MIAVRHQRYGGPEVLEVFDTEVPKPGPGQVLVRQIASSINAADYRIMRADPFIIRFMFGLFRRRDGGRLGGDVAGIVEKLGPEVSGFAVGDAVMGTAFDDGKGGAFAERVLVSAEALVRKPEALSFPEAAALPLAGMTALDGLDRMGEIREGEDVLIQGAGGGVGHLAVQIAKARGARVTAVCGPRSRDLIAGLGADRVLDHSREDFADAGAAWDLAVAVNGHRSLGDYRRALRPGGRLVTIGGTLRTFIAASTIAPLVVRGAGRRASVLTLRPEDRGSLLAELARLAEAGAIRPRIAATHSLRAIADAFRAAESGHVGGKIVVAIGAAPEAV